MKKLLIIILVSASFFASAQKRDSVRQVADSTALVSARDYDDFLKELVQELPAKYADPIRQWWIQRFQLRVTEYLKPKK